MGQLLTNITTYLTIAGVLVVGLSAFAGIPALLESRGVRRSRQLSIPAFYFHTAAAAH